MIWQYSSIIMSLKAQTGRKIDPSSVYDLFRDGYIHF